MVDVATGWTECLPLITRDGSLVVEAIKHVQSLFPWLLRGVDFDNDSAFMNDTVVPWCREQKLEVTRSRAYKKNDQAFVEQKNGAVVRRLMGYGRFDGVETARVMSRLYAAARLYVNFFQPSFKLKEKRREGAKVIKRYHAPSTPYERALTHPKVPAAVKRRLRDQYRTLNPVALLADIRRAQEELGNRIDRRAGNARCQQLAGDGTAPQRVQSSTLDAAAFAKTLGTTIATIPIVFSTGIDPVQAGLVASLNRPGGNVTGVITMNNEIGPKRLGLLHQLLPAATRFAVLFNPTGPAVAESVVTGLRGAASAIGGQIEFLPAGTEREIDAAFASLPQGRIDALLVSADLFLATRVAQILTLAAHYRVPAALVEREDATAGWLMSYGSNTLERFRYIATYTGRILKGEKPADLPVQQATRIELIINMTTAKALGVAIPETLLATADEVIQ
jgi:ABC-type uncharacterized transport system substrate-binding protein